MAPQVDDRVLRSVNYRLKNSPTKQLPKILPHITSQLSAGKYDLSNHTEATWLKAKITSLLQDRTTEGRWSAVILVKTVLEAGGPNVLFEDKERLGVWIRGLIDILKKPGPIATKKCAVVAITRVFMLTWDHPTLVRELTTPTLPTFITTCLQHFQTTPFFGTPLQSELVGFMLESFASLLPRHHTVFRSFQNQIRNIATAALCNDPFDNEVKHVLSQEIKDAASTVLVLLHQCAQKGGGAVEWEKTIYELTTSIHATTDQVYRAIAEDWQSVAGVRPPSTSGEQLNDEPGMGNVNTFPPWSGLRSGAIRLEAQLALLRSYIDIPTATSVKLPLGRTIDLLTRLLYVQVPRTRDASGSRYNAQVGRSEHEELWAVLPSIHVSTLEIFSAILSRLETAALPLCAQFADLTTWLFEAESFDSNVRTATYHCIAQILEIAGPSFSKATASSLDKIIKACCSDLLPVKEVAKSAEVINGQMANGTKASKGGISGTSVSQQGPSAAGYLELPGLHEAASALLPVLLAKLPAELVSKASRTEMDRTAVLTKNSEALAASVLNPAPGKASLLPLLSSLGPESQITEAILRPRMPVILSGKCDGGANDDAAKEESEDEEGSLVSAAQGGEREQESTWTKTETTRTWAADIEDRNVENARTMADVVSQPALTPKNLLASSGKRGPGETIESESSSKRVRVDEEATEVSTFVVEEDVMLTESASAPVVGLLIGGLEEDSDDDDGSDFEIPQLQMQTGSDDEDEDEEE